MQLEKDNIKFNKTIESSIKKLREIIDADIIIGNSITFSDESTIIPISKVSFLSLAGGGEYGKTNIFAKNQELPYSAGNGTIVNVKPCGFIIKKANGDFTYISTEQSTYEKIFNKATDIIKEMNEN